MSIDSSVKEEKLGVQIQVSSKKIQKLLEKGISPSEILSDVIGNLSTEEIDQISKGKKSLVDVNELKNIIRKEKKGVVSLIDNKKTGIRCPECKIMTNEKNYLLEGYNRCYVCEAWRGRVKRYIEFLVNKSNEEAPQNPEEYDDYDKWDHVWYSSLVSLLISYYEHGNDSPTGKDLLKGRLHPNYIRNLKIMYPKHFESIWQEELRTSKTRLTIEAKHRGLDAGPLRPPYGNKEKRKHPMFPLIYNELKEFFNPSPASFPMDPEWTDEIYMIELGKLRSRRDWIVKKYRFVPLDQRRLANYDID
ncbi:hypothetical protein OAO35_00285 [Euryarchaeota archaeon]|nr:hypothetical protein [Euryarchaeota archaeon]